MSGRGYVLKKVQISMNFMWGDVRNVTSKYTNLLSTFPAIGPAVPENFLWINFLTITIHCLELSRSAINAGNIGIIRKEYIQYSCEHLFGKIVIILKGKFNTEDRTGSSRKKWFNFNFYADFTFSRLHFQTKYVLRWLLLFGGKT